MFDETIHDRSFLIFKPQLISGEKSQTVLLFRYGEIANQNQVSFLFRILYAVFMKKYFSQIQIKCPVKRLMMSKKYISLSQGYDRISNVFQQQK